MVDARLTQSQQPEGIVVSPIRAVAYGGFAGGVLALCLVAPAQMGALAEEPVKAAAATIDQLFPDPVDPWMFRHYDITLDDSVSTDVQRRQVVKKIGHGRTSQVTIVTTPSGTYSTDGILSPYVRYPGIEKSLRIWPDDYIFAEGGRWMSYADGSFIYLVFRVPRAHT
jgi:hypothetical protein